MSSELERDQGEFFARFSGIGRLYGMNVLERFRQAHVCVVGVGGVGSWAVEALARSGIGALTLIDLDEVCVSNVNRQLPALTGEVGKAKVQVLKTRIAEINPECTVNPVEEFFTAASAERLLERPFDSVLDAVDQVRSKCELLAGCRKRRLPVVTVGGAGGRRDPTLVKITDLAFTSHDPLLQQVRKALRYEFGFPQHPKAPFGISCVFSPEPALYPQSDGTVCATRPAGTDLRMDCNNGYGSVTSVTGAFGFAAAAEILKQLSRNSSVG